MRQKFGTRPSHHRRWFVDRRVFGASFWMIERANAVRAYGTHSGTGGRSRSSEQDGAGTGQIWSNDTS